MFKILQPPPAQTMVQALELLYALGGKKQSCQDGKVNRKTVLQLQDCRKASRSYSVLAPDAGS